MKPNPKPTLARFCTFAGCKRIIASGDLCSRHRHPEVQRRRGEQQERREVRARMADLHTDDE